MTHIQKLALLRIEQATICRNYNRPELFRLSMKLALGSINKIENTEIRKAAAKQWFRAFNVTNNQFIKLGA